MVADNIIVFKRTSTEMLRPRGVTHNYHHRYELVIPLEKSGRIHVDGTSYQLSPGTVYLIFPHQFHHYLDVDKGKMKWMFITFEPIGGAALQPLRNSPRMLGDAECSDLDTMLRDYVGVPPGAERSFNLVFNISNFLKKLLVCRVADCVIRVSQEDQDTSGSILEQINMYVRSHLGQSVTIADLAKHMIIRSVTCARFFARIWA